MIRHNYILKIQMDAEEASKFASMTPLIQLSITENEANLIARLLGYKNARELVRQGFKENPYMQNAFITLSFLYITKEDKETFDDFWSRLIFTDKDVEKKVKRTFNIKDESDCISTAQLELMWMLETDKDEWDDTVK